MARGKWTFVLDLEIAGSHYRLPLAGGDTASSGLSLGPRPYLPDLLAVDQEWPTAARRPTRGPAQSSPFSNCDPS